MSVRIPRPAVMDGDTAFKIAKMAIPSDQSAEEWLLNHPQEIESLAQQYVNAGSQIVCTPTATADRQHLKKYGLEEKASSINKELTQLTAQACHALDPHVLVAGSVSPLELYAQPFGETPFLDIVNIYAEQAFALKWGGAQLLIADRMTSLSHCRAAILGCKQTELPIIVVLDVEADGETSLGCDLVAALIVCQSLGARAFGLTCRGADPTHLIQHVEEMAPYTEIPLVVKAAAENQSCEEWANAMSVLWEKGASILGGGYGAAPEHVKALAQEMRSFDFSKVHITRDMDTICMAGETEPYFLDEFFQQSEPIYCSFDMSDELLEAEETEANVITIQVDTSEDAYNFAENAHMLHKPVSFLSDNEEALEMALLMFNGRAFVDSRSNIEEETLKDIAFGYGAIIR